MSRGTLKTEQANQPLKLFMVKGKESSSAVSQIMNHGDDYGELYPFTELTVAESPEAAVEQMWTARQKREEEYTDLSILSFPPSIPQNREEWKATEVKVKNYHITIEPE